MWFFLPQLPFNSFSLKLPLRQGMRCSNQEAHRSLIFRLNLHIRKGLAAANAPGAGGPSSGTSTVGVAVHPPRQSAGEDLTSKTGTAIRNADLSIC